MLLFSGKKCMAYVSLIFAVWLLSCQDSTPTESTQQPAERVMQERSRKYARHLEAIKDYMKEKMWCEAESELRQALNLRPDDKLLLGYQVQIKRERVAFNKMQEMAMAVLAGECQRAKQLAKEMDPESEYFQLGKLMGERCQQKQKTELLAEGKRLLEKNMLVEAAAKFQEASLKEGDEADLLFKETQVRLSADNRRLTINRPCSLHGNLLIRYLSGDLEGAVGEAEVGSPEAALLRRLRGLLVQAEQSEDAFSAIEWLEQALELDKALCGNEGAVAEDIRSRIASRYIAYGREEFANGNYRAARQAFLRAEKLFPNQVKNEMQALKKVAKKLYEEAYIIKNINRPEAVKKLELAVDIVPIRDKYFTKISRLLSELAKETGNEQKQNAAGGASSFGSWRNAATYPTAPQTTASAWESARVSLEEIKTGIREKRFEEVIAKLRKVLEVDPRDCEALIWMGAAHATDQNRMEAATYYQMFIEHCPSDKRFPQVRDILRKLE